MVWHKCKNVALLYVENLDFVRTIKALYKHDKVEVVDMDTFEQKEEKREPLTKKMPKKKPWASRVRCVETGEEWPSVAECARCTGIAFFSVNSACLKGKEVNGKHYEFIKDGK